MSVAIRQPLSRLWIFEVPPLAVWACANPVEMRWSFGGLAALVSDVLDWDQFDETYWPEMLIGKPTESKKRCLCYMASQHLVGYRIPLGHST